MLSVLGLRPAGSNSCAGRRRHRSDFEACYLVARDYRRLGLALDRATEADPVEVACIRFLMLTEARRARLWTSNGRCSRGTGPRTVLLGEATHSLLRQRRQQRKGRSRFVFPSPYDPKKPRTSIPQTWRRIRAEAGLAGGLRLHDLRRTYASHAVMRGETLMMAGRLLGHHNTMTTERYAHLADRFLFDAAERVAGEILKLSNPCLS